MNVWNFARLCKTKIWWKCIVYIKATDIYKDIAENIETRFDTSNYELDRPLPKGKNKKVIGLMKLNILGGQILRKLVELKEKTYSYTYTYTYTYT